MDSRWLHRAAGTVGLAGGLAGGILLLGAGAAQADEAEEAQLLDGLLSEVFSPTSGLPPLDLSTGTDPVLDGLPTGAVPLDGLGIPDGAVGGLPTDGLLQLDGATIGLPNRLTPQHSFVAPDAGPRTLPAPAGQEEILGPGLLGPVTDGLLGGASLGNMVPAGQLLGQVPVAGPMVAQTASGLPLVDGLVPASNPAPQPVAPAVQQPGQIAQQPGQIAPVGPAAAGPGQVPAGTGQMPAGTEQVPAVIAQELAAERGFSPELLDDRAEVLPGLPLLGPALDPLNKMFGIGNLPSQLPVVGPLAGPALGNLPVINDPAPRPLPAAPPAPAGGMAGAEEAEEVLPLGGLTQALPLDALVVPLAMLQSLPLPVV